MVRSDEPALPGTDMSDSEFEDGAPTLEEEIEKKSRSKRGSKSRLTAAFES